MLHITPNLQKHYNRFLLRDDNTIESNFSLNNLTSICNQPNIFYPGNYKENKALFQDTENEAFNRFHLVKDATLDSIPKIISSVSISLINMFATQKLNNYYIPSINNDSQSSQQLIMSNNSMELVKNITNNLNPILQKLFTIDSKYTRTKQEYETLSTKLLDLVKDSLEFHKKDHQKYVELIQPLLDVIFTKLQTDISYIHNAPYYHGQHMDIRCVLENLINLLSLPIKSQSLRLLNIDTIAKAKEVDFKIKNFIDTYQENARTSINSIIQGIKSINDGTPYQIHFITGNPAIGKTHLVRKGIAEIFNYPYIESSLTDFKKFMQGNIEVSKTGNIIKFDNPIWQQILQSNAGDNKFIIHMDDVDLTYVGTLAEELKAWSPSIIIYGKKMNVNIVPIIFINSNYQLGKSFDNAMKSRMNIVTLPDLDREAYTNRLNEAYNNIIAQFPPSQAGNIIDINQIDSNFVLQNVLDKALQHSQDIISYRDSVAIIQVAMNHLYSIATNYAIDTYKPSNTNVNIDYNLINTLVNKNKTLSLIEQEFSKRLEQRKPNKDKDTVTNLSPEVIASILTPLRELKISKDLNFSKEQELDLDRIIAIIEGQ